MSEQASRNTLALNPLVGFRGKDLVDSAGIFFKAMINEPQVAADQWLSFVGELTDIVERQVGSRAATPATRDSPTPPGRRVRCTADCSRPISPGARRWTISSARRASATPTRSGRICSRRSSSTRWRRRTACIANPAAVRKLIDSGGQSLLSGLKNYLEDLVKNGGLPSQVDMSAFKVGENLANTPGAVVFRNELIELIQYAPTTPKVWKRPLVMTPPQINKYLCDGFVARQEHGQVPARQRHPDLLRQLAQSDGRESRLGARHLCRRARRGRRRGPRTSPAATTFR